MVPRHDHGTHQEWSSALSRSIEEDRPREESTMSRERVTAFFGNDMNDEQLAWCIDLLVPEAEGVITEPVDLSPLGAPIPRTWILTTSDAIMTPEMQRCFIGHVDGNCRVIELDAGHMCMITQPEALAHILNDIASQ
jgi:pimeloyl-ACP methyl ester carboxylesterase